VIIICFAYIVVQTTHSVLNPQRAQHIELGSVCNNERSVLNFYTASVLSLFQRTFFGMRTQKQQQTLVFCRHVSIGVCEDMISYCRYDCLINRIFAKKQQHFFRNFAQSSLRTIVEKQHTVTKGVYLVGVL